MHNLLSHAWFLPSLLCCAPALAVQTPEIQTLPELPRGYSLSKLAKEVAGNARGLVLESRQTASGVELPTRSKVRILRRDWGAMRIVSATRTPSASSTRTGDCFETLGCIETPARLPAVAARCLADTSTDPSPSWSEFLILLGGRN